MTAAAAARAPRFEVSTSADTPRADARATIERVYQRDRARNEAKDAARVRTGSVSFDARRYGKRALARVRARWQMQRVVEYRSTAVFLDLAKQLMEAGASPDATAVVVRMAHDEYRHADLCGVVTAALGCDVPLALTKELPTVARHEDVSREVAALRNVILCTCISETNAVANFVVELEHLEDPLLRAATRALLADEILHGEFGFRYLEQWIPFLASSITARDEISRYLRFAFAYAEQELLGTASANGASSQEERALGLLDHATRREIFLDTMTNAIVPGLERFGIAADDAFRTRRLAR